MEPAFRKSDAIRTGTGYVSVRESEESVGLLSRGSSMAGGVRDAHT